MTTLVSVNVGMPRDIVWQNRTVHTGVFKAPVAGPVMVRRLNIDGDGQGDLGGHGGENRAVLVYQLDSYRHWADTLGRDDLVPGHLGENFTVDGLADDEVCIGDRYRIGDAVFEVTQPRVTCYRVGIRLGVPNMASLLVSHCRPGFYLRVVREGEVTAGQQIVKVSADPRAVSVAEIDAALYLPGHSRDVIERALEIPALSPGWRTSLLSLVDSGDREGQGNVGLTDAAAAPPPAWPGFRRLTVAAVTDESSHVRSLTFRAEDGETLPSWFAGQSITVRVPGSDRPLLRNYSLSNSPGDGEFRISVKRELHGLGSGYLHTGVTIGDQLEVAAPRGAFFLRDSDSPVVLISAGVGATPVLSMLHALTDAGTRREVWWLHGARDGAEHPFAAEARRLLDRLPGSHSHVVYSRPSATDTLGVDYDVRGRLTVDTVRELGIRNDADVYLCGPAAFMAEHTAGLVGLGFDAGRVHSETFGTTAALTPGIAAAQVPPHLPAGPPGNGPMVEFARSGISAPWDGGHASILEFAEACDVPTRWSCRTGVCHNCETALVSGAVAYEPEPLDPPAPGNVLTCCSTPTEAIVVDL